ncbi:MAG: hypothetical protein C0403_17375 [Desulfobacterium sp.]|nr:hypothetical protein [Desulfobacterium sp.]
MKPMKRVFVFLGFFFLSACFPQATIHTVQTEEESKVILYLQPMMPGGSKIRCIIDAIHMKRDNGDKIPLTLFFNELKGDVPGRQKRLASGGVLQGAYTGLVIRIKSAFLEGEEGEAALLTPDEPVDINLSFNVADREVVTLFLSFETSGAILNGVKFTPIFSLEPSKRILTSFIGYVSNTDENWISVFNKKTMQVVGGISTGRGPMGMALDPKRGRLYIATSGDNAIDIIDVFEWKVIDRITLHFGDTPIDLALSSDGRTLMSVNNASNTVSIIDTQSMFEIERIQVGESPASAVIHPSGLKAYVMNSLSNSISVVDLARNEMVASMPFDGRPEQGAFNQRGDELYIVGRNSPHLLVIDPSRLRVIKTIFVGMENFSILVNKQTDLVFVGNKGTREIAIISSVASMYIDRIGIEGMPAYMSVDNEENTLFVVLPTMKTLQKLNLTSKKSIAEIDVGEGAYAVVVMGDR